MQYAAIALANCLSNVYCVYLTCSCRSSLCGRYVSVESLWSLRLLCLSDMQLSVESLWSLCLLCLFDMQLSVESLWSFTGMSDKPSSQSDSETGSSEPPPATDTSSMLPTPTRSSQCYGLDIHSCLQLLTDVYGSTLLPSQLGPSVPITLFNETIRSVSSSSHVE